MCPCIPFLRLLLPSLAAAAGVFVTSSLVHMVFQWHNGDYRRLPDEEALRRALREDPPAPGQYLVPHCAHHRELASEAMRRKWKEGPVALLWIKAPGEPGMGSSLGQWFLYTFAVSLLVAVLGAWSLPAGAPACRVFPVTALAALLAYGASRVHDCIWMGKPWSAALKDLLDAVLFAAATGAILAWLWPR